MNTPTFNDFAVSAGCRAVVESNAPELKDFDETDALDAEGSQS
jgi:hypothetical protein